MPRKPPGQAVEEIAVLIRRRLKELGLSPFQAARRTGLPDDAIKLVLKGSSPSIDRAAEIADISPRRPSRERLHMEVRWLDNHGLVTLRKIEGAIDGVVITEHGRDVAEGRESVQGVPPPGQGHA